MAYFIINTISTLIAFVLGALSFRAGLRHGFFLQKGYILPAGEKKEKDSELNPEEDTKKDWTDQS